MTFETFSTWGQLLDHAQADYPLWYQAPLDARPVMVSAVIRKDGRLRVTPPYSDCDACKCGAG